MAVCLLVQPMPHPPLAQYRVPNPPPDAEAQNIPLPPQVLPHGPLPIPLNPQVLPHGPLAKRVRAKTKARPIQTLRACCICKEKFVRRHQTKCRLCARHYDRVYYWKRKLDSGFTQAWNKISQDRKTDFIKITTGLTTDGLKNRMTLFLAKEMGSMRTTSDFGTGQLDRYKRKYTDKLKQLKPLPEPGVLPDPSAGLAEFCKKWEEKCRRMKEGLPLDEDTEHQSGVEAVETRGDEQRMDFSAEATVASGAGDTTKIEYQETKRLDDCLQFLKTSAERLETIHEVILELGSWVPPVATEKKRELRSLHASIQALANKIKETGECVDLSLFIETMSASEQAVIEMLVAQSLKSKMACTLQTVKVAKKK